MPLYQEFIRQSKYIKTDTHKHTYWLIEFVTLVQSLTREKSSKDSLYNAKVKQSENA